MKILGATDFASPVNLARPNSSPSVSGAPSPGSNSFGDVLVGMMNDLDGTLRTAEKLSVGALTGDVPLQKVVESVVQAEQKVQLSSALRDKIVAAYLELTRMPI
jgi:flagellar hook-basal body complex protein FliE